MRTHIPENRTVGNSHTLSDLPGVPTGISSRTLAILSITVVLAVAVALVVSYLVSGPTTPTRSAQTSTSAPTTVVREVTSVPPSAFNKIGTPAGVSPPTKTTARRTLTVGGKPLLLYAGGDYCPFCAAERWAIVESLSRFGTFSGLQETRSSGTDVYPNTASFSFAGSSYRSTYLVFEPTELYTNIPAPNGGYTPLQTFTPLEARAFATYDQPPISPVVGAFPFVDVADRYVISGASYNPGILRGLDQNQIAAEVANPKTNIGVAVGGTANYITAAVCTITGNLPFSVCRTPAIRTAERKLTQEPAK
jgi:hypothetical protein